MVIGGWRRTYKLGSKISCIAICARTCFSPPLRAATHLDIAAECFEDLDGMLPLVGERHQAAGPQLLLVPAAVAAVAAHPASFSSFCIMLKRLPIELHHCHCSSTF